MADIIIKNGYVITMDEDRNSIERGDVAIEGNEISRVGEDLGENAETVIDARKKAVMPGLINGHTHLSMTLFRGVADDLDLQTWLNDKIWPMESNLESEHAYWGALLGCLEMIKSGTTCFADHYFFMDRVADAVDESGMRANLAYGIIENDDPEKREEELEIGEELVKNYEGTSGGRINTMFGPHSTYTCSQECLKEVRNLADKYGVGIHIHVSENKKEVERVKESEGMRPPKLLESIDLLDSDVLAAHCTWLNEEEIDLIKEKGVKPVHNPVSNMKLGSGIAHVPELLNKGVPVNIGTDGAGSNNSLDMLEEIKFAATLAKIGKRDPTALPAQSALEMATINGAKAVGREDEIGSLEPGKKADIILIDLKKPHLTPITNIESHIVYSASGADVDTVLVDGNILMKNRKVTALDEPKILKKSQESTEEIITKSERGKD